jgi:hypothetical protein
VRGGLDRCPAQDPRERDEGEHAPQRSKRR